nr:murein L,D-transpeptidase catalytic domain family protein [Gammaproteobacteria bacterium]
VVVHGANYVEPNYIKSIGHAGRSWGCLAVAKTLSKSFINLIKDGSVIFAYYPDKQYISHSHYL